MVFYKQVLEFHTPSKFLCQTSGRQNHWSLLLGTSDFKAINMQKGALRTPLPPAQLRCFSWQYSLKSTKEKNPEKCFRFSYTTAGGSVKSRCFIGMSKTKANLFKSALSRLQSLSLKSLLSSPVVCLIITALSKKAAFQYETLYTYTERISLILYTCHF